MFEYRRNVNGDSILPVPDRKLNSGFAGAKGSVVKLNASGEVVAAATADTAGLGVYVGPEIRMEKETDKYGKVQGSRGMVFEATKTGAGTPVVGGEYGITVTSGDGMVNVADTTNKAVRVVAVRANGNLDVIFINPMAG